MGIPLPIRAEIVRSVLDDLAVDSIVSRMDSEEMRHATYLLIALISVSSTLFTSVAKGSDRYCDDAGCCEQSGCWPRLKFMDDLATICQPCPRRDPYEERIETERHDFTQSTKTVGHGVCQIESGYSYFYHDQDEEIEQTYATPEMMLRMGLSDDIEFRLRFNYGWQSIDVHDDKDGAQDLIWSFKFAVTDQTGCVPESALELRFSAPLGSSFSTERVDYGFDNIYGWEIAEGWELYGSTGYFTGGLGDFGLVPEEPAADWFAVWTQSVALGVEVTENMTIYSEFFGLFSHALEDDFSIVFYNIGIDYYLSDNFVIDVRAGKGLTPDADDFFTGVGGGYRF